MSDITEAVETCIILHNMMVEEHRDQEKEEKWDEGADKIDRYKLPVL